MINNQWKVKSVSNLYVNQNLKRSSIFSTTCLDSSRSPCAMSGCQISMIRTELRSSNFLRAQMRANSLVAWTFFLLNWVTKVKATTVPITPKATPAYALGHSFLVSMVSIYSEVLFSAARERTLLSARGPAYQSSHTLQSLSAQAPRGHRGFLSNPAPYLQRYLFVLSLYTLSEVLTTHCQIPMFSR